ncbi:MAG: hypothetical protein U0791_09655 [Gemmataceae bacterium]
MNRMVLKSRVGKDGCVLLAVPAEVAAADQEVQVTIEPVAARPEMSPEEWRQWVLSFSGTWEGPFERPEQDYGVDRDSFQ